MDIYIIYVNGFSNYCRVYEVTHTQILIYTHLNDNISTVSGVYKPTSTARHPKKGRGLSLGGPASKVGICGSDMAYWSKGMAGGFVPLDFSHGDARFSGHPGAAVDFMFFSCCFYPSGRLT